MKEPGHEETISAPNTAVNPLLWIHAHHIRTIRLSLTQKAVRVLVQVILSLDYLHPLWLLSLHVPFILSSSGRQRRTGGTAPRQRRTGGTAPRQRRTGGTAPRQRRTGGCCGLIEDPRAASKSLVCFPSRLVRGS